MLPCLLKLAGDIDDLLRFSDRKLQGMDDNALSPLGVRGQNVDAFLWPAMVVAALFTAMPVWGPRLWISAGIAAAAFAVFIAIHRRVANPRRELTAQCLLILATAAAIAMAGGDRAMGATVYRHLLLPLAAVTALVLLGAAAAVKAIFAPLQAGSTYAAALPKTELFQSRGERVATGWGVLLQSAASVAGRPLLLLLPAAIATLAARVSDFRLWSVSAFAATLLVLGIAGLDERLDFIFRILTARFFRNAALVVSVVLIALAGARWAGSTYVTTVVDTAQGYALLLYLLFAYALTWWYDYWIERMLGQQLLLLIAPRAGNAWSTRYDYRGEEATSVPAAGRTFSIHGLGRFLVHHPGNPGGPPLFHSWPYHQAFQQLAAAGTPGGKAHPQPYLVEQRIAQFTYCAGLAVAVLLGAGAWWLSRAPVQAELTVAASTASAGVTPSSLLPPADRPLVVVAASGGGTRAAVYAAAVLEGLSRGHARDIAMGSGVSGGAAALAYYAGQRPQLTAAEPGAWDAFFATMSMPFIQDVIHQSTEWRMLGGGRLGILLAESFEQRWELAGARDQLGEIAGFGLILNTTLAGSGIPPREDAAGGRLILTNLAMDGALRDTSVDLGQTERLPVVISDPGARLERGAALSANFPPVFSNAAIDVAGGSQRYWVTDGGAADNRGLEMLLLALEDALRGVEPARLPPLHVVVIEASAVSDSFQQNRGIGSALGGGAQFAAMLDARVWSNIAARYQAAGRPGAAHLHYLPMPRLLRTSGSFGTHWMLQDYIEVESGANRRTFRGPAVVEALRAAYGCRSSPPDGELLNWVRESAEFRERWCPLMASLPGAPVCGCPQN